MSQEKNKNVKVEVESNVDKRIKTSEEAFQEIGYGKSQIEILIVVSCILITSLNENIGISFILPSAQCDLNLSTRDKGILSGMVSLGKITILIY
jgi:MFS transporter, VNT family, synaptic vesicle glycoprotein 2